MYPRTNYEMTEDDLKKILEACKPTPVMLIGGYSPPTPQENANRAWAELGKKMGFDHMTVKPISGKDSKFFTAVPLENEIQKKERLEKELERKKNHRINEILEQISKLDRELKELRED